MILDDHDALLLDLDGTVYRGGAPVGAAPDAVALATARGVPVRYVTNNAGRPPADVAATLAALGIRATPDDVDTSAQAAADVLGDELAPGAAVLVVGSRALADEVAARGLEPVWDNEKPVQAVVQGLDKGLGWVQLAEACVAINAGARWLACNVDPTLPTERGLLPGNGALVAAVRAATAAEPDVAGKPAAPLLRRSAAAAGARAPLVVGDRLDTDVAGAQAIGADSLLVLSGGGRPTDLLRAPENQRPRYVAADLSGIRDEASQLRVGDRPGWTVEPADGVLQVTGCGEALDLLRSLCAAAWRLPTPPTAVTARDEPSERALRELGSPLDRPRTR